MYGKSSLQILLAIELNYKKNKFFLIYFLTGFWPNQKLKATLIKQKAPKTIPTCKETSSLLRII